MLFVLPNNGKYLGEILDEAVELEDAVMKNDEFIARFGKVYKISLSIAAALMIALGTVMLLSWDTAIGILCFILAGCALLILPTLFSYQCAINKSSLKEKYLILFIQIKKEVFWDDIKYKKVTFGQNSSIIFYDKNKKRIMSFDNSIVGFNKIMKMAKRREICNIKHNK